MSTRNILWIDGLAAANIEDLQERMLFILRDDAGTHVTIWLQDGVFRFECSSAQPLGSVWDEAKRGIARNILKYPNWQKHANYFTNRPLNHFADSSFPLITFSMPRTLKAVEAIITVEARPAGIRTRSAV